MAKVVGNCTFRTADDCFVNEEILKIAEEELGETPEVRERCLQELRETVLEIKNLRSRMDNLFLLRFLRVSKFDTKLAFARLQKYYEVRKKYPEIFQDLHPKSVSHLLDANRTHVFMPYRNSDYSLITIQTRGLYDPDTMKLEELSQLDVLQFEPVIENPVTQICGTTCVIDFEGMHWKHLIWATTTNLRRVINITIGSMPLRYKRVIILNGSVFLSFVYNCALPLLSKKFKDRIVFHRKGEDWSRLHSYVSPEILPKEYGGNLGPVDYSSFSKLLMEKDDFFKAQLNYGYVD